VSEEEPLAINEHTCVSEDATKLGAET